VISHDEHLVASICEELWVAEPGKVSVFKGSGSGGAVSPFAEYRQQQLKMTKRGMLPRMAPNAAPPLDVTDPSDGADGGSEAPKPKPKIEIVSRGSMSKK